jgi:flavin reductase (DIM6/NTAB) family NADH-FMN oxidoreductase RutF
VSEALAELPLPVVVVAAATGSRRSCSTGTATYVSHTPPLVATSLARASRTLALLRERGTFTISVLGPRQAELAVRAAQPSSGDKFAEQSIPLLDGDGAPAVDGAALVLWCSLAAELETETHVVCVGRVDRVLRGGQEPLVRYDRRYRTLGASVEVSEEARYPL